MPNRIEDSTLYQTELYDYVGGKQTYIGKAHPGSAENAAVWQIYKLGYTGNNWTSKKWANGSSEYEFKWSDRAGYIYS